MSAGPARAHPWQGVMLTLLAVSCFAAMDAAVRHVGQRLPMLLILATRYAIQTALMAAWIWQRRDQAFRTAHPRFQVARGLLLLASSAFTFTGLQHLPLAEITAINLLGPIVVTVAAAWLLHERLSRMRLALVVGGFIGALIVVRPGSGLFGAAVLFPLGNVLCFTGFQLLSSRMATLDSPYTTNFYTGITAAVFLLPLVLVGGHDLVAALQSAAPADLALVGAIGLLGTTGHLMLIMALTRAPTSTLMPLLYVQLGVAAGLGWLLFGDLPDAWGWLGMAVIAVCGAATAWLNVRAAAAAHRPLAPSAADTVVE